MEKILNILISGGLLALIAGLIYEKGNRCCKKRKMRKSIRDLFNKESEINKHYIEILKERCLLKIEKPKTHFNSIDLRFNAMNYILDNLLEIDISIEQFEKILELKALLENILFWEDEYVNGTKGKLMLIEDQTVIQYYIPKIIETIENAENKLQKIIF